MESIIQIASYTFWLCTSLTHVESDNRSLHPFCFQLHDFQAPKELLLSHEIGFKCIDKHRLTKAARATQVIILFPSIGKLPDDISLINIKVFAFSNFFKRLDAYRQFSIVCLYHNYSSLFLSANLHIFF